jgi:hypothetical protein
MLEDLGIVSCISEGAEEVVIRGGLLAKGRVNIVVAKAGLEVIVAESPPVVGDEIPCGCEHEGSLSAKA